MDSDNRRAFLEEVKAHPNIEYSLFELGLIQDGPLKAIMSSPMQEMQKLLWRTNVNKLSSFLKKAVPLMKPSVAAQLEIELKRGDYKVALARLLKYIKDTRHEIQRQSHLDGQGLL